MQQILRERHSGETKQIANWSVLTFKGKLKFFRFKIVKYKTRALNRKIEIIFRLPRILLSLFRVGFSGFYAQFHRLCYKTIGSCF